MSKSTVLLLGSGTQGFSSACSLKRAGYRCNIITSEKWNYGGVSKAVSKTYYSPSVDNLGTIQEIIHEDNIDVIIPMGDDSAEFISKNKRELHKIVKFEIPEYDVFLRGYDKNQLLHLCLEYGFPCPITIDMSEISNLADSRILKEFPYPAMLKPNQTTGGRGMIKVNSYWELIDKYPELHSLYGDYHLQKFIRPGGRQVKVQLYINSAGDCIQSSVIQKLRWYPNEGGSSSCAVTIDEPDAVETCKAVLKKLNWVGFADFDLIEDPDTGKLLIMEINPRVPACIEAAVAGGVEWGEVIADSCLGKPVKKYEWKTGEYLRHFGFEMLWMLHSTREQRRNSHWWKFFGRHVHYQDCGGFRDPLPFICGTFHNFKKLLNPNFKK